MVDPLDPGTIALPLTFKRGRGRPRKIDALSAAERARRYRARKKASSRHVVPEALYVQAVRERDAAMAEMNHLRQELGRLLSQLES
ncbi:hypothetical protein [Dyella sp. 20L07]|uniref:hypothetical protein n=1 Tax=Dyella sp. 20L07 TaxID=3384240 RepID=UPI003D295FD9